MTKEVTQQSGVLERTSTCERLQQRHQHGGLAAQRAQRRTLNPNAGHGKETNDWVEATLGTNNAEHPNFLARACKNQGSISEIAKLVYGQEIQ